MKPKTEPQVAWVTIIGQTATQRAEEKAAADERVRELEKAGTGLKWLRCYKKQVAKQRVARRKKAADPEWQEANRKGSHNRYHVKGWFSEKTGKHFPPKPSVRCPLCSEQGLVVAWG